MRFLQADDVLERHMLIICCRFRGTDQAITVQGEAWSEKPFIRVNAVWLIYPAILYIMLTSFLFATLFHTRDTPLWKSSALALLHSCDNDEEQHTIEEVVSKAAKKRVRLQDTGTRKKLGSTAVDVTIYLGAFQAIRQR